MTMQEVCKHLKEAASCKEVVALAVLAWNMRRGLAALLSLLLLALLFVLLGLIQAACIRIQQIQEDAQSGPLEGKIPCIFQGPRDECPALGPHQQVWPGSADLAQTLECVLLNLGVHVVLQSELKAFLERRLTADLLALRDNWHLKDLEKG